MPPRPRTVKTELRIFLKIMRYSVLAASLVSLSGCTPEPETCWGPFNEQNAFNEVKALVQFSPRDAGTTEGWKAANHIAERLNTFGIDPEIVTFSDETPNGTKTMRNVLGMIPGKNNRWIILGSHFDTMPGIKNFQGANDSGSSTGVLLELARLISASGITPQTGIIFTFFDGEEGIADYIPGDGLHGSRRMVSQLRRGNDHKKINAMILMDMVGDKDLHFTIPYNSSQSLVQELLKAAHATGHRDRFSLARSIITDDHVPFLAAGIPSINIIDFKFGSKPGLNDYWHTNADNLNNITPESLKVTGEVMIQLINQISMNSSN